MRPNMLAVVDEQEAEELLAAALRVLEAVGVLVTHSATRDILIWAGGRPRDNGRLHLPGVAVDVDTLAEDVVREVGPGGDFITHAHTAKHCRSGEIWYPSLLDRSASGAEPTDLYDRAHRQVEGILKGHVPEVDDEVRKSLFRYVECLR